MEPHLFILLHKKVTLKSADSLLRTWWTRTWRTRTQEPLDSLWGVKGRERRLRRNDGKDWDYSPDCISQLVDMMDYPSTIYLIFDSTSCIYMDKDIAVSGITAIFVIFPWDLRNIYIHQRYPRMCFIRSADDGLNHFPLSINWQDLVSHLLADKDAWKLVKYIFDWRSSDSKNWMLVNGVLEY